MNLFYYKKTFNNKKELCLAWETLNENNLIIKEMFENYKPIICISSRGFPNIPEFGSNIEELLNFKK